MLLIVGTCISKQDLGMKVEITPFSWSSYLRTPPETLIQ
ncbi:hypothetical protein THERMOT_2175 [Bathymodiolus thermophilus thioautotrophic gill symbiont]|nr:hypothetical protein THERMOT_2175 [Bathymodiolus thermophilus thioautotrophic gill symbiont]